MITTGAQLKTFIDSLNSDATIDATLMDVLVSNGQAVLEEERPWVVLRKVDTSKTVATSSTWETSIDLSTITNFNRFYSEWPIKLYDGANRLEYYRLVPFDRRVDYRDVSNTASYDENAKLLYLHGTVPFAGTLYISYLVSTTSVDLTSTSAVWSQFPSRFLPILGFYAIGVYKGAIDWDDINKNMLPENRATLMGLKMAMEKWDDAKQGNALDHNDPTDFFGRGHRNGAINREE